MSATIRFPSYPGAIIIDEERANAALTAAKRGTR